MLARSFTARRIELLGRTYCEVATELLDRPGGQVDLVAEYAVPLPSVVISELLGVPVADRTAFQGWTTAMLEGVPEQSLPASRELAST